MLPDAYAFDCVGWKDLMMIFRNFVLGCCLVEKLMLLLVKLSRRLNSTQNCGQICADKCGSCLHILLIICLEFHMLSLRGMERFYDDLVFLEVVLLKN